MIILSKYVVDNTKPVILRAVLNYGETDQLRKLLTSKGKLKLLGKVKAKETALTQIDAVYFTLDSSKYHKVRKIILRSLDDKKSRFYLEAETRKSLISCIDKLDRVFDFPIDKQEQS